MPSVSTYVNPQLAPATRPPRPVNKKRRLKESGGVASGLMLAPSIIFLAVCSIYPFIWIFRYVLYNYDGIPAHTRFTGMRNITNMFADATFWGSVGTTFEYALWKLLFIIPLALLMAVLLNQKLRGSGFFRGVFFMPTVISSSISGMIFTFIFATGNGILNGILQSVGIVNAPVGWLTDTSVVMASVIIMSVWAGFGNYMLYFVTGMTSISEDVYESSRIDGANAVQTFFKITLPMLSPVLKVVLMLAITGAFKDYEAIMVLTNGGPGTRTNVMFLYIYNLIFGTGSNATRQIGYGALLSLMAAVIVGAVTIIYNLVAKKLDDVV
ncbi:MAG: sugar ABC transporter permease [Clostridia bacterium]|nr:sugar ABC transporter permease [Clostridia bacterium]